MRQSFKPRTSKIWTNASERHAIDQDLVCLVILDRRYSWPGAHTLSTKRITGTLLLPHRVRVSATNTGFKLCLAYWEWSSDPDVGITIPERNRQQDPVANGQRVTSRNKHKNYGHVRVHRPQKIKFRNAAGCWARPKTNIFTIGY